MIGALFFVISCLAIVNEETNKITEEQTDEKDKHTDMIDSISGMSASQSSSGSFVLSTTGKMSFADTKYCEMFQNHGAYVCWFVNYDGFFFAKAISMVIIVTAGLIGNFLLLLTILSSERLRSNSVNIFIVNLSISNFLNLSLTAPVILIDSVTEFFILGKFTCHAMRCAQVIFFVVPMLTLLAISVDRFLAIRYLIRGQNQSWKTYLVCLAIWCIGLGMGMPEYQYKTYSVREFSDLNDIECYENFYMDGLNDDYKGWKFQRIYW